MRCFIIVYGDDPTLEQAQADQIESAFPDRHHRLGRHAWVVASDAAMPHEICDMAGIPMSPPEEGAPDFSGVVGRVDEYNGLFARVLWEKIRAWEAL